MATTCLTFADAYPAEAARVRAEGRDEPPPAAVTPFVRLTGHGGQPERNLLPALEPVAVAGACLVVLARRAT